MNDTIVWRWFGGLVAVVVAVLGLWWFFYTPPLSQQLAFEQAIIPSSPTGSSGEVSVFTQGTNTVAQVLATLSGSSQFEAVLSSTGVSATLGGKGPYTVFVSTDAGYNLLPKGTVSGMTPAQKKRFAQYAVVSGRALNIDAVSNGMVQALSGDTLNFHVGSTGMVQVNSSFALQEYKVKNGIIYVINQPLLPPVK